MCQVHTAFEACLHIRLSIITIRTVSRLDCLPQPMPSTIVSPSANSSPAPILLGPAFPTERGWIAWKARARLLIPFFQSEYPETMPPSTSL